MCLSTEEKRALVSRYHARESVAEICVDAGVARSTFYTWIKLYTMATTSSSYVVSQQEFNKMKKIQKLEQKVEILQKINCTASAPLQEKLKELAKLYGQYGVHALCEALCVSRGTFYNHIFRRKEVTAYDKRRAEMKEHIKTAFDESHQRFGANKISAVLSTRDFYLAQICSGTDAGDGSAEYYPIFQARLSKRKAAGQKAECSPTAVQSR